MPAQFKAQMEWRSPDSIKPYGRNNKKHTDSTIKKLADQIRRFGWDVPIVVDGAGTIIKGHRRYRAAMLLKLTQIPVITRSDLTREEVRAARLADNRLNDDSLDDIEAIASELAELNDLEFDLDWTGYDAGEIEAFLAGDAETEYQPPEPGMNRGGKGDRAGGDDQAADDGNDTAESKSPQEKYPLAIVLTWTAYQRRNAAREKFGIKSDTVLYEKLLEVAGF